MEHSSLSYLDKRKTKKIEAVVFCFSLISFTPVFAQTSSGGSNSDFKSPKLFLPNDIYVNSKDPVPIYFEVKAVDNIDGKVPVECTRSSGGFFKLGKTLVTCSAIDYSGNRSWGSFVVTVGYDVVQIPKWIKQTTEYWVDKKIEDKEYIGTIEFLIKKKILKIPFAKSPNYSESEIPKWIKWNAKQWVDGKLSDDEYSIGLHWLINRNYIKF